MGDERLIELVKQYEVLYNNTSNDYRNGKLRNAAWEEISKLHGQTVEECKVDWNKLRNCFNNAMKRRHKKSGKKFAPWRFEEQMSFLKPYMEGRPVEQEVDHDHDNTTVSSEDYVHFVEVAASPESDNTPQPNTSHKRKASSNCDHYLDNMMEIMKTSQENRTQKEEMDDLDTFFLSMSKSVKKLPKLDQIRIKMDLLKAISDAEVKQLKAH